MRIQETMEMEWKDEESVATIISSAITVVHWPIYAYRT